MQSFHTQATLKFVTAQDASEVGISSTYPQYSLIEQVKEPCLGTPSVKQEGINSEKYSLPLDGIQSEKCNALQLPQQH